MIVYILGFIIAFFILAYGEHIVTENKFLKRELKKSQERYNVLDSELEDERDENDRLNTRIIELQTTLAKRKTGDPEPLVEPPHII